MQKLTCDCRAIHVDVVEEAKADMLKAELVSEVSNIFKIVGDSTRIKLVWALNNREMCVCDLAVTLGMTKSAISHQLKTMKKCSIVKSRKQGKNVYYSLYDQHVTLIIDMARDHIDHIQCSQNYEGGIYKGAEKPMKHTHNTGADYDQDI